MQKEIRQKPKYKQVEDGFSDVLVYVTKDNKEFKTEKEAMIHEADLVSLEDFNKKYHHFKEGFSGRDYDVIIIDELTKENKIEIGRRFRHISESQLRVGVNLIFTDDSGDYTYQSVDHPEDLLRNFENEIEEIKNTKCYSLQQTLTGAVRSCNFS
jgi:hypothetical protein